MKKYLFICLCLAIMLIGSGSASFGSASFGRPNVALGGTVISSTPAVTGSAANINDGLLTTLLYSNIQDTNDNYYCEFVLDLTESYSIDMIDIYIAQTRGFSISVSEDNDNWTLVKTKEWEGTVGTAISIPFETPIVGRYIKYYGWASWNQHVGVVEMAVFETGSEPALPSPGSSGTNNIAIDKQIVNDPASEPDNPPASVLDGDLGTSWIPAEGVQDDETDNFSYSDGIVIDLGEEVAIGKVVLQTNAYHSIVVSFPAEIDDYYGEKWLFHSNPDKFVTNTADSGEIVFDIKGLVTSRYITVHAQTMQVTDVKPEISEVEVYEWSASFGSASFGRPNVALGGTVISSTPAVNGDAAHINDGLLTTLLYSHINTGGIYYCEFVLDLTKSYSIDMIDIYFAQTRGFSISISENNVDWTLVETREWAGTVGTAISIPFEIPIVGRYIKYYGWASWNQYVGVVEMAVFETGSEPAIPSPGSSGTNNIAIDKQIVNDPASEPDNPPANVLDGDLGTSWIPAEGVQDDETDNFSYSDGIVIDLGEEVTIVKVVLQTNAYHSIVVSFPTEIDDYYGEKWLFHSNPDKFVTNTANSGEIVFDIKGLVTSRYITVHAQTMQVTDVKPEISEVEVYEWIENCPDSDGDGVTDRLDQCPATPLGSIVHSNGCPAIKGDFNNNEKLDLGDCIGILKSLSGK